VPFAICVVSVLKIAFCDQKKRLTIFYLHLLFFFQASYYFKQKGVGKSGYTVPIFYIYLIVYIMYCS